jgi:hypothetical protein
LGISLKESIFFRKRMDMFLGLLRQTSRNAKPPAAIRIHNLTSSSELIRPLHTTMAEEGQSKRKREEDDDEDTAKAAKEAPPAKHIV